MIIHPKRKKNKKKNSKNYINLQVSSIDAYFNSDAPKSIRVKLKPKEEPIKDSFGESIISDWLRKHNVKFIREKKFKDLKNPMTECHLRFDFYLPDKKMCIEFDGKQHFAYSKKFDKGDKSLLKTRQYKDAVKDRFCIYRGFKMLRISYKQIDCIERLLCVNCL